MDVFTGASESSDMGNDVDKEGMLVLKQACMFYSFHRSIDRLAKCARANSMLNLVEIFIVFSW